MTIAAKQKPAKREPFDLVATLVAPAKPSDLDRACRMASREQLDEAIEKLRNSGGQASEINGAIAYLESWRGIRCVEVGEEAEKKTRTDVRLNEGPRSSPRNGAEISGEPSVSNFADGELRMFNPQHIRRSPFNRETRNAQKQIDLVESVRTHGVQQPGKVRPLRPPAEGANGGVIPWELIMGEGRWLAAMETGRDFPAIISDVDDVTAIEMQAVENMHREDLNPLDEAVKYQQLLDRYEFNGEHGMGATAAMEKLCQKVQREKSTVYERLRLLKLPESAKKALQTGRLPASHAGLIAKLDDHDAQVSATAEILKPQHWQISEESVGKPSKDGIMSFRETKHLIERKEKEIEGRRAYNKLRDEFIKKGGTVLTAKESKKLFRNEYSNSVDAGSGYVGAEDSCPTDGQYRSWKKALGKHAPTQILAESRHGEAVIVYKADEAKAAAKKAGLKKTSSYSSSRKKSPADLQAEADQELREKAFQALVPEVVRAAENMEAGNAELWRMILRSLCDVSGCGDIETICQRRGITGKGYLGEALQKAAETMNGKQLRGLIVELLFSEFEPSQWQKEWNKEFAATCKLFGVKAPAWKQK